MQLGQAQVQDQQVKLVVGQQRRIGLTATGHMVHHRSRGPQRAQQAIGQHLVVFGDEDAHERVSWGLGPCCWSAAGGMVCCGF